MRTAILAALTKHPEKVRKLHIKPKEAGAFHFPGHRNVRVFHASRVITAPYHEYTNAVCYYKKGKNNNKNLTALSEVNKVGVRVFANKIVGGVVSLTLLVNEKRWLSMDKSCFQRFLKYVL